MILVKTIMTKNVVPANSEMPIYEALSLLRNYRVSGLPVVNRALKVVGILTEKDVLRILFDKNLDLKKKVDDYMTRDVVMFEEDNDAMDICKFFMNSNIRRVPIVREEKLVGIVSRRDIVQMILDARNDLS